MITIILCLLSFVAGLLVYRKHAEKLKAAEAEARAKADAVKSALR
jgi:F0F1-type ATP synthase assembly protein I